VLGKGVEESVEENVLNKRFRRRCLGESVEDKVLWIMC